MNLWFLAPELLAEIEISKDIKGVYRVCSHPSDKPKRANPEETIRQLVLAQLRCHYHYPHDRLIQEYVVQMGIAKKRADIAIMNGQNNLESIIEVKQIIDDDSILQLQSYMLASGAKFGAVISLHMRKVFMRDLNGTFIQISDLPVFERVIDSNGATTINQQLYPVEDSTAKALMAALGVTGITRVSNSVSHLHIKNRTLKLSNTNLLSYKTVRKQAIQEGIILPSTVGTDVWDRLLLLLFENAADIETPTAGRGDTLGQFIHSCARLDPYYDMPAKDFLEAYQKWYITEGHPERWKPTRNATYDQLRAKGYRIPDNRTTGGTTKILGLDLKVI